jgi:hypothetical protein
MSITIATPPPQGEDAVRAGLDKLLTTGEDTRRALVPPAAGYGVVSVAAPHPVYVAGPADVLEGTLPASAELSGWRYILLDEERALAAAEVRPRRGKKGVRFTGLNTGAFVESTVRGVAAAEELEEVRESDYEFRLLNIPSLYVVALWLHGRSDIFIPLPPTPRWLAPYSVYSAEELVEVLREPAAERQDSAEELFET